MYQKLLFFSRNTINNIKNKSLNIDKKSYIITKNIFI